MNLPSSPPVAPVDSEEQSATLAVEAYLEALSMSDRALRGRAVREVLKTAVEEAEREPGMPITPLAMRELDRRMTDWFAAVLDEPLQPADALLSARGRLALLLADMPGQWQAQFLQPGPWPAEFVRAMRESFLRAGPEFQVSPMQPRPIDLGPIATLTKLGNLPYFRMVLIWIGFALLLVIVFRWTH